MKTRIDLSPEEETLLEKVYGPFEDTYKNRIIVAVERVRSQYIDEDDEEGQDRCMELLDRLTGYCGPSARIEI